MYTGETLFAQHLITQARKLYAEEDFGLDLTNTVYALDSTTIKVCLSGFYSQKSYPHYLRRIRFKDPETGKRLIFLTNLFDPPSTTICELYKARWKVELFFKWLKQHLRIKKFYGTSENAVKVQIWTAVSVYVLIAIIKKCLNLDVSLYTLLQVFSVTLFEKMPLNKDFFDTTHILKDDMISNQLNLFNN